MADCVLGRCNNKDECNCPPMGTYAFTAFLMAGPNPTEEEGDFWDNWKDEMKDRDF